jgi:hypothetical protein
MENYKIPALKSISVFCKNCVSISPQKVKEALCGRVLHFSDASIQTEIPKKQSISVTCSFSLEIASNKCMLEFDVWFHLQGLYAVPTSSIAQSNKNTTELLKCKGVPILLCESYVHATVYAVLISHITQVVVVRNAMSMKADTFNFVSEGANLAIEPIMRTLDDLLLNMSSKNAIETLFGVFQSVLCPICGNKETFSMYCEDHIDNKMNQTCRNFYKNQHFNNTHKIGCRFTSVLVTGQSGSGLSCLVDLIAKRFAVKVIHVSLGTVLSRYISRTHCYNENKMSCSMVSCEVAQHLLDAILCACVLQKCVIVLDDVHLWAGKRIRGNSSKFSNDLDDETLLVRPKFYVYVCFNCLMVIFILFYFYFFDRPLQIYWET